MGLAQLATTFFDVFLTVKLNGVGIHNQTMPFNQSFEDGDSVEYKYSTEIPSFVPSGNYALTFQFRRKNGSANGCIAIAWKF